MTWDFHAGAPLRRRAIIGTEPGPRFLLNVYALRRKKQESLPDASRRVCWGRHTSDVCTAVGFITLLLLLECSSMTL